MNRFFRLPKLLSPSLHSHSKTLTSDLKLGVVLREVEELQSLNLLDDKGGDDEEHGKETGRRVSELSSIEPKKVHISHPWQEWVDLMELLLKKGYFQNDGYDMGTKDSNRIRTACLNFGRDRFDLIRYFSRRDIWVVVGSGCPSLDRKVVNSGKRLRGYVGIDEGNVCSSCSLRGSCERAYVKAREDEGGRTVDVMRILLTYGLDPITGSVDNKPSLSRDVKDSVRKLMTQMVEFGIKELDSNLPKATPMKRVSVTPDSSIQPQTGHIDVPMKQGDWACPKCNFINFARNIKCLRCDGFFQERLRKFRENQDHLPLKKGDWLCETCNFLNFAKNTKCLQCKEKPPNRQLNPGEWECESCNYVNFKRNMVCLKCDWKRPKASNYPGTSAQLHHEDRGPPPSVAMKFVRDEDEGTNQFPFRQQTQSQKEGAKFYVEDDGGDNKDGLSLRNRLLEVEAFPILGGKSKVSQDPQARDKWKKEMLEMRGLSRGRENYSQVPKITAFSESADDCKMAEWFGYGIKIDAEKHNLPTHLEND